MKKIYSVSIYTMTGGQLREELKIMRLCLAPQLNQNISLKPKPWIQTFHRIVFMAIDSTCYKALCNKNILGKPQQSLGASSHRVPGWVSSVTLLHCTHIEGASQLVRTNEREPISNRSYTWFYGIHIYKLHVLLRDLSDQTSTLSFQKASKGSIFYKKEHF